MSEFTVRQTCYFSAAHVLRDYPAACEKLHGHNYKVIIEVTASQLDKLGMVLDYLDIENIANKYVKKLDHQYINNIKPFDEINPTTENIAYWLYQNIKPEITDFTKNRASLRSITIWETDHNCISYQELEEN